MTHPKRTDLTVRLERAVLAGVVLPDEPVTAEERLEELAQLAKTAGARIVSRISQRRKAVDSSYFIGKGKAGELREAAKSVGANVIIFDHDLTPGQLRNLEAITDTKVVDRSELILDIFATHARSAAAKVQVELAQLEYSLPRLRRMWTHLGRIEGGIGTRGPGEQQLEVDRRRVRRRISDLKRRIRLIERRRETEVKRRSEEFCVCIVGYTNAGKSTLMNALTGAGVRVEDKLFATLDTRTRPWNLPGGRKVLLSDTVGFIRNLPHHLVASFMATLEEAKSADLLLHIVDGSHNEAEHQIEAVNAVLEEIGCARSSVLLVLNKYDAVSDLAAFNVLAASHPDSVVISALRGERLHDLALAVGERMSRAVMEVKISIPAADGRLYAALCRRGEILSQGVSDEHLELRLRIARPHLEKILSRNSSIRFLPDSPQVIEPDEDSAEGW
ncbi:MAG: GTPase HflX [Planctomycetota bacterium]|jgi:GTP-binding protein HflX